MFRKIQSFVVAFGLTVVAAEGETQYGCPVAPGAEIRQGDSVAPSGGRFDSTRAGGKKHGALDLNAKLGDEVFAARSGRVALAEVNWDKKGMGTTVIIDHGDGDYTVYGHLDTLSATKGKKVAKGDKIGTVGYSGNAEALKKAGLRPHLHFALIKGGKSGLADEGKPLRRLKEFGDYWQDLGADISGPVNPGLFISNQCWKGSTTVGAPSEK